MREKGTEECGHTCPERNCTNMKGSEKWEKEGHSVRRHERSKKRHPQCAADCPRYFKLQQPSNLGKGKSKSKSKDPQSVTSSDGQDDEMDINPPELAGSSSVGDLSNVACPSSYLNGF